jgi:hypothetical protein
MRSVGFGLALLACVQFAVVPAFAADASPTHPAKTASAKKKKKKKAPVSTLHTTSGEVQTTDGTTAPATDTPAPTDTTATPTPAPATPAPAPAPVAPAVAAVPAGSVTVHINSPKSVSLEKRSGATSPWEHVCNSPCDVATSSTAEYQIVGETLNDSKPFLLDASQGDKITLDVTPGVHNKAALGGWVVAGGAVLAVGGIVTLVAGSKSNYVAGDNGTGTPNSNTDWIFVGSGLIVAGVIAGLTGGAFMFDNAHTKVDGAIGAVPDKETDVKPQVQVTASRLPTWHEDTGPRLAPSRYVSLLQGSF